MTKTQLISNSIAIKSELKNNQEILKKRDLGQFFTTNCDYILQGFERFVKHKEITDPFAGNQDLLDWVKKNNCKNAIGFDYDKKCVDNKNVFFNDSLNSPKKYQFICTNPPYLHKNKASKELKEIFFKNDNSQFEDLYQISLKSCFDCDEGIIIIPLNFLCAQNSSKIRELFFTKFSIVKLNIFSTQVFADTTYNVISFYFKKNQEIQESNIIDTVIYPQNSKVKIELTKKSNWQFGGDFIKQINKTKNYLGVFRLTENIIENGDQKIEIALQNINQKHFINTSENFINLLQKNILFLRAIDSKNGKKIQLEDIRNYKIKGLIGKNTSRNMAHLIFRKPISIDEQSKIIKIFNEKLNENRQKYFSFFLTNFRDNNRKRISFETAYKLINLIYEENDSKQSQLF
jgi:hypothetical protein